MSATYLESLKSCRERAGVTQKEVEVALGLRSLTLRDYEIGRLKLPVSVALKLAELYRVSADELLGNQTRYGIVTQSKALLNFASIFSGHGYGVMFLDPILRAFAEGRADELFESSIFDLMTQDRSEKQKKEAVLEITKMLFSLASCDGKISDSEIQCVRELLGLFNLQSKFKEVSVVTSKPYFPLGNSELLQRIEMRHFVIWILFFFAHADRQITHQELEYIEKCAEALKINKSNFHFIKEKLAKEQG